LAFQNSLSLFNF